MRERWLDTVEERARAALAVPLMRFLEHGARDGVAAGEAVAAWDRLRLAPHVLRDVTDVDASTTLLGTAVSLPAGVAPTTLQRMVHPEGEVAMARAVAAAGSLLVVSSNAGVTFAEIGATGVAWWLQAYLPADRTRAEPLLARAVAAGARAVVLTVDTPVVGVKYEGPGTSVWDDVDPAHYQVNFDRGYGTAPGSEKATDLGPHDIGWLAGVTGLPVVVKGVLRADDARRCVQAGAAAVWVSNHGGRQLDHAASTVACLPAVVGAVDGPVEVYVDGGVRSGLSVLLATCLGARAAFLGRLPVYALAADAEDGVRRMFTDLTAELAEAMRLTGCRSIQDAPDIVLPERQTPR